MSLGLTISHSEEVGTTVRRAFGATEVPPEAVRGDEESRGPWELEDAPSSHQSPVIRNTEGMDKHDLWEPSS